MKSHFCRYCIRINIEITTIGMVSGTIWNNLASDHTQKELIIAGEWMFPSYIHFNKVPLEAAKSHSSNVTGRWYSIGFADLKGVGINADARK